MILGYENILGFSHFKFKYLKNNSITHKGSIQRDISASYPNSVVTEKSGEGLGIYWP